MGQLGWYRNNVKLKSDLRTSAYDTSNIYTVEQESTIEERRNSTSLLKIELWVQKANLAGVLSTCTHIIVTDQICLLALITKNMGYSTSTFWFRGQCHIMAWQTNLIPRIYRDALKMEMNQLKSLRVFKKNMQTGEWWSLSHISKQDGSVGFKTDLLKNG